jgi:acyl-CoA thioesterase YciA
MNSIDDDPIPSGQLTLQIPTMPADTNADGDIFGGWMILKMDLAGSVLAREIAKGRVTTVAVSEMSFLRPVPVGATVSCYCDALEVGRSSIHVIVEVWLKQPCSSELVKVTEATFVYVAIDDNGRTRQIPKS